MGGGGVGSLGQKEKKIGGGPISLPFPPTRQACIILILNERWETFLVSVDCASECAGRGDVQLLSMARD